MSDDEKKSWLQAVRETIYGMAAHDMSRAALRTRASMEHLFILMIIRNSAIMYGFLMPLNTIMTQWRYFAALSHFNGKVFVRFLKGNGKMRN